MAAVHGNQQSGWPVEELMNGLTLLLLTSARWEPRDQAGRKKPIIPGQPHLFFYFFLDVEFFKRWWKSFDWDTVYSICCAGNFSKKKFYWRKVVNFPNQKNNWMIFLMIEFSSFLCRFNFFFLVVYIADSLSFRKPEGLIQVGWRTRLRIEEDETKADNSQFQPLRFAYPMNSSSSF